MHWYASTADMATLTITIISFIIFTLCAYVQQGYAFGHVGLCKYVGTFMYLLCRQKNRLFSALLPKNFLLNVICCLLFEFKRLQCGLLCPASYYIDGTIHAFPNNMQKLPGPVIFIALLQLFIPITL